MLFHRSMTRVTRSTAFRKDKRRPARTAFLNSIKDLPQLLTTLQLPDSASYIIPSAQVIACFEWPEQAA